MDKRYCSVHDAYYYDNGEWAERQCTDPNCDYCIKRPVKHMCDCECGDEDE